MRVQDKNNRRLANKDEPMMNRRKFAMMYSRPQYCSMAQGLDTIRACTESKIQSEEAHKYTGRAPYSQHRDAGGRRGGGLLLVHCGMCCVRVVVE